MYKPFAALLAAALFAAVSLANAQESAQEPAAAEETGAERAGESPGAPNPESHSAGSPEAAHDAGHGAGTSDESAAGHAEIPPAMTGDPGTGQSKSAPCAACHGPDGNSPSPEWPHLAGQHPGYLVEQLQRFKSGERQNAVMQGMSAALSEQDMRDIAAYNSRQTVKPGLADEAMVEQGARIYRGGDPGAGVPACIACHGPTGAGIPGAVYPRIGGQHAQYLLSQLELYASGERQGGSDVMNRVAERMSASQMRAVASYISGLHLREGAFDAEH